MKRKQSSPDPQSGHKLEKVDTDKSDLLASYGCLKDGLTTVVPLGTDSSTIKCVSCGSRKHMIRIVDEEDPNQVVPENSYVYQMDGMKTQYKEHLKYDEKTNKHILVTAPDDDRGIGSHDPFAIMGYNQPSNVIKAMQTHREFKSQGEWKSSKLSLLEEHIIRTRQRNLAQDDVFAKEITGNIQLSVLNDMPEEFMEVSYTEKGKGNRNERHRPMATRCTLPETKGETYKREQNKSTKDNIINAISAKTAKLQLFGTHDITDFQINTCNKHLGVKPLKGNITYEQLTKHMKAYFYARREDNKQLMETSKRKIILSAIPKENVDMPKLVAQDTQNCIAVGKDKKGDWLITLARETPYTKYVGEDSPFNNIPEYETKDINIYDYEPTVQITSETHPKVSVDNKPNNASQLQNYLETNRNDNSSGSQIPSPSLSTSHQLNEMLKLGIVGASNPADDNVAYQKIKKYVQNLQKENPEIEIVSGGASGVDSISIQVAKELNLPFKVFEPKTPNWDGFKERNLKIAEYSDKVVSFANEFKTKKCYHCERVGKDNNHEKTAGCYTGYNHGEYETIILGNRLE